MPKKQEEIIVFEKTSKKAFVRDLNIALTLVIILLSIILFRKIVAQSHQKKITTNISKKSSPLLKKIVYAAEDVRVRIPLLMYHYVENVQDQNDTIRIGLNIPPAIFEEQLLTMQNEGYSFLTMQDVSAILKGQQAAPEKSVVLTFDDGYRDFYDVVFPLLKKYHIKAVSYVAPGLLNTANYMDANQVIEIAKSGLVEVASHTVNHRSLQEDSLPDAYYEVYESKAQLEQLIGMPVTNFAYPYGSFDDQAVELVRKAGYDTAVTTLPGDELTYGNRFLLDRIRPGVRIGVDLLNFLKQKEFTAY